jgi:glycosyltransferase involved in cell wall biosynthesis
MESEQRPHLRLVQIDLGRGWAGGQTQSFALAQGLAEAGHEVIFICRIGSELSRRLADQTLGIAQVRARGRLDMTTIARMAGLIRGAAPQVVHLHDSLSFWLGGIAAKMAGRHIPVVMHKRTDHIAGWTGAFRYAHFADRVIAISEGAKQALLQSGVAEKNIALIHSSVDCVRFQPGLEELGRQFRREMNIAPEEMLVAAIGTLAKRKGHDTLLEAAPKILQAQPQTRFVICGSGPLEAELKAQIAQLELAERVILLGERNDVRPLLAALEVFAMPSRAEGLGVAALEAGAMGKPVVASRVGGLQEVVENGKTGLLVAPNDPQELAQAILQLLNNATQRAEFGNNARARVMTLFSRTHMLAQTEALYWSLCTQR